MKNLGDRINDLPPDLRGEVEDFVDFLVQKRKRKPRGQLSYSWAGALGDLKEKYTSVQLQHEIANLRSSDQ